MTLITASREVYRGPALSLLVLSRAEAGRRDPGEPYACISITGPGEEAALCPSPHCRGVLRLQFDDVETWGDGYTTFHPRQAEQVIDFALAHPETLLVIHCEAGISRSAGVAAALSWWRNGTDAWFQERFHPNALVRRTLIERLWRRGLVEARD